MITLKILPFLLFGSAVLFSQKELINKAIGAVASNNDGLSQSVKVAYVKDGDTVKLDDGRDIRLCGIDAPETAKRGKSGQSGGEEAKKFLEQLVSRSGGNGYLVETDKDKYGRTVGELFLQINDAPNGEVNVNSELIMYGHAYFYKQYSKCPNADRFKVAEEIAQKNGSGVWSDPSLEKPWDFRKRK